MDFKSRLNSCGRFSTDENFKKIIMRNSCRLRQNSAINQKELYNNKESKKEVNNIKILRKQSDYQSSFLIKESNKNNNKIKEEKIEKIILPKKLNIKRKKYYRHTSNKININYKDKNNNNNNEQDNNKNEPTSSNILFFYQDIRALTLYKNNDIEQNLNTINDIEKPLNNKYITSLKKKIPKKDSEEKREEEEDIFKCNTLYNDSQKKRKHFLLKRIKYELDNNLITNEIKIKKNLFENKINNTFLNISYFNNNNNNSNSNNNIYSTEISNYNNKMNNNIITKDNCKLYRKPQKSHHERNKVAHNSVSLFPVEISKDKKSFYEDNKDEEKESIKKNFNKSNSEFYNINEIENDYISYFFCELIDLSNGMEEKSLFDILVNNLNKKYICNYKTSNFPNNNSEFIYCFRYFCVIITPLIFLSKDFDLYKYLSVKGRLLINQFIYSSLYYVGYNNFDIPKINNFIKKYNGSKKLHMMNSTSSFVKLIFGEKQEYEPLKNALIQLIKNILNESIDNIMKILNNTILFCFNNRPKEKLYYPFKRKKSQTKLEENSKNSEPFPSAPFIKTSMKKEFCLVLDIDETISHSLKLSYGYYFLLRPGTLEFLNELSNYYEIDIFTSSLKLYADFIIDKIDTNGNLISYRLYKHHVTYEKGKSVKKLNMIGRDLNKIIFVDNLKTNAKYNLKNLCHITSWTNDIYDEELIKLKNKLKFIATSGKYNDDITKGL